MKTVHYILLNARQTRQELCFLRSIVHSRDCVHREYRSRSCRRCGQAGSRARRRRWPRRTCRRACSCRSSCSRPRNGPLDSAPHTRRRGNPGDLQADKLQSHGVASFVKFVFARSTVNLLEAYRRRSHRAGRRRSSGASNSGTGASSRR